MTNRQKIASLAAGLLLIATAGGADAVCRSNCNMPKQATKPNQAYKPVLPCLAIPTPANSSMVINRTFCG